MCLSPLIFSLDTVEFSRGYVMCSDVITLIANGMCVWIFLYSKNFNIVNTNRYNLLKQKLFGVLNNF